MNCQHALHAELERVRDYAEISPQASVLPKENKFGVVGRRLGPTTNHDDLFREVFCVSAPRYGPRRREGNQSNQRGISYGFGATRGSGCARPTLPTRSSRRATASRRLC